MSTSPTRTEAARIAEEGYLFGFPLVLTELTRQAQADPSKQSALGSAPPNQFAHLRTFPPGDFRTVVRPNFDTLYSTLWYDVREEPLIVAVPDMGDRYFMLPFLDMWTDVFAVVGSRTTGSAAGTYALARPGWTGALPEGITRIDAPTPVGWVIGRTQTNGPADYAAVNAIQDAYSAVPLSTWLGGAATADPAPEAAGDGDPLDRVLAMSGVELLDRAAALMAQNPPHLVDQPVVARLRRLGVVAGRPFDTAALDPEVRDVVDAAARNAARRMTEMQPHLAPVVHGWATMTSAIGVYGTDYLRRAVIAKVGLGANLAEDAVYPLLLRDADGEAPLGDTDYVLHFDAGALPPADAFWSVTMYDGEGFPVTNPLERYALGDRDPLQYNEDGSLDLIIQHQDPGPSRRSNWLPSPSGPIGVTMRLYDPRTEVLDGTWAPPPLVRA